jgi:hypothetical protein
MDQDPRIDQILQITKDTNHVVHKMRRAQLWGRFYQVAWWLAVLVISGYTYYHYLQPQVDRVMQLYTQVQAGTAQAQSLQSQVSGFFGNWLQQHPAAATTTTTH